jgi:hypothetical protein
MLYLSVIAKMIKHSGEGGVDHMINPEDRKIASILIELQNKEIFKTIKDIELLQKRVTNFLTFSKKNYLLQALQSTLMTNQIQVKTLTEQ